MPTHVQELRFVRVDKQRIYTAQTRYFFKILVHWRDNIVTFAGGEPEKEFGVIHIAECPVHNVLGLKRGHFHIT